MITKRGAKTTLLVFAALAAGYVLFHAGTLDLTRLWTDEIRTANAAAIGCPYKAAQYASTADPDGIAYSAVASIAVKLAGPSETSLRFPALIFGALCIPLLFLILSRATPAGVSIVAPLALFFSPPLLFASMTARGYSMFVFFALAALLATLRAAESGISKMRAALLFVSFAVASLIDLNIWIALPAGAAIVFMKRRNAGDVLRYAAVAFAGLAPALALRLAMPGFAPPSPESPADIDAWRLLVMTYTGAYGGFTPANAALAAASFPLALHGLYHSLRFHRSSLVHIFIWFAFIAFAAVALSGASTVSLKKIIPLIALLAPFACLIFSVSPCAFASNLLKRDMAGVYSITTFIRMAATGFIILFSLVFYVAYTVKCVSQTHFRERENWREPISEIASGAAPGDALVVKASDSVAISYFIKPEDAAKLNIVKVETPEEAAAALRYHPRSWLIARDRSIRGIETGRETDWRIRSPFAKRFGGALGDILFFNFDGYFIDSASEFIIASSAPAGTASDSPLHIRCSPAPGRSCSFKVFLPESDEYSFLLTAPGSDSDFSFSVSFCGEPRLLAAGPGEAAVLSGKFRAGSCEVDISFADPAPSSLRVGISKKEPL
ncbi:MAG TPA: glycosyltransferase family 39 protein [bacterium]|nr:glycosyltransferase family 39 protein [bacterium]